MQKNKSLLRAGIVLAALFAAANAFAGDADIKLPDLHQVTFFNGALSGRLLLFLGLAFCVIGVLFGFYEYLRCRALPVHKSMGDVSHM
ncbi:MAG: sodium-translocating pyrophosphatase, partial [Candidatus Limnocylindria bacterium]